MRQVGLDHAVLLGDFVSIVRTSFFVPAGREEFFAYGLNMGMCGDIGLAIHLLIPQVEHALREIARAALATDDSLDENLKKMLVDPEMPQIGEALTNPQISSKLSELLGVDTIFALRVVLIERFGGNLRNVVEHGLISYGGACGYFSWYLWWLVLRICWKTPTKQSELVPS